MSRSALVRLDPTGTRRIDRDVDELVGLDRWIDNRSGGGELLDASHPTWMHKTQWLLYLVVVVGV